MFLDAGYSPSLFWELGLDEINDLLESYARKAEQDGRIREARLKDEIMVGYNQAHMIGNIIGHLMDNNIAIRKPKDYYPDLFATDTDFTEQEEESGDEHQLSPEMELHKARMDDFIFRHNRAMKERMAQERGESSGRNDFGEAASNHRGTDESLL